MSFPINLSISVNEISFSPPLFKIITFFYPLSPSSTEYFLHSSEPGLAGYANGTEGAQLQTSHQNYFNNLTSLLTSRLSLFQTTLYMNGFFVTLILSCYWTAYLQDSKIKFKWLTWPTRALTPIIQPIL